MKSMLGFALILAAAAALAAQEAEVASRVQSAALADNLYEITAYYRSPLGAKLLALTGPDGILMVDTGMPPAAPLVAQELKKLSPGKVRYILNTHLHDDHIGGNAVLAPGAVVIAHDNVRRRLSTGLGLLTERPEASLPSLTFDGALTLRFNGEEIRMIHFPAAHTDGDCAVYFVRAGIVALGDLAFPDRFPYVAPLFGGSIRGVIGALETLSSMCPEGTRFVAAHGPVYTSSQLKAYHDGLARMADVVKARLKEGKTPDQLKAEKILSPWASWGDGFISADQFLDTLVAGGRPAPAQAKPSILDRMVPVLLKGDGVAAAALYRRLKKENPGDYAFDEEDINQLGYALLQHRRNADALVLFQLNVEEHPDSWNAYDSLGEAYMNDGQKEPAIKNYEKSLELNPGNANGVQMLEKLGKK